MSPKSRFLAVVLALGAATAIFMMLDPGFEAPEPGGAPVTHDTPAGPTRPATGVKGAQEAKPERTEVRTVDQPSPPSSSPASEGSKIKGLVKDIHGLPVGGLTVTFEVRSYYGTLVVRSETRDEFTVRAGDDGLFTMARPTGHGYLVASGKAHATLLDCEWTGAEKRPEIVVAPRRDYSGIVVYGDGGCVADEVVAVQADAALILSLRPGVQPSAPTQWTAKTDEAGRFDLAVAWSPGTTLGLTVRGFDPIRLALPDRSDTSMQLRLVRSLVDANAIAGKVVWESGKPADAAIVHFGRRTQRTDADGRFAFERDKRNAGGELTAAAKGWSSAPWKLVAGQRTGPIVLTLSRRPMTIRGRVVDGRGQPMSGPIVFTRSGPGLTYRGRQNPVDSEGRFVLPTLRPGKYVLFAFDPKTLEAVRAGEIEAGTEDLEIVMPGTATRRRVAGRVLTLSGNPLPGVRLLVGRSTTIDKSRFYAPLVTADVPRTDAEGRFAFDAICVEGTYLIPSGTRVPNSNRVHLDPQADLTRLEIRLPVTCRFQVLMRDPEEATAVKMLDAKGRRLSLMVRVANSARSGPTMTLEKGHSEIIQVDERATTLVLLKDSKEVRRIGVTLDPEKVKVIRL